jgi:hypothetical protein
MANQQTFPHSPVDPPERVTSDPVPVPSSSDADRDLDETDRDDTRRDAAEDVTDRVPGDALDDRGTFEDPVLSGERNDPDDLTAVSPGAPEFHEPAPQQTAFGAATVAGAAAAAAQAGPSREVRDRTDAEAEGAAGDRDLDAGTDEDADRHADHNGHKGHDVREDLDADRTTALDADRTTALDEDRAAQERADEDAADRGHLAADAEAAEGFDRERPVDGASDLPETAPAVDTPASAVAAPAVEEPIAGLWGEETVQGYRDRWREVQLRFVDDPPAAARDANVLVEEAVGALTAELSRQKAELGGWSGEDTEDLRAVVRRHRDFLDRLLGL